MIRYFRFWLGRALIHAGLHVLPDGRVRSELFQMIDVWATKVTQPHAAVEGE